MDMKPVILIAVILIAGVSAGVYILTATDGNDKTEVKNLNGKNQTTGTARIVATQRGPETARPGSNITVTCKIKNEGKGPAKNVKVLSQDFERSLDVIEAGEEVEFQVQIYIPTEEEVKEDFGENATLSNPFFIGGFSVTYTDLSGKHSLNSNSLEIPLQI